MKTAAPLEHHGFVTGRVADAELIFTQHVTDGARRFLVFAVPQARLAGIALLCTALRELEAIANTQAERAIRGMTYIRMVEIHPRSVWRS